MQMYFRLLKLIFRVFFFRYKVDPSKPFERDFRVTLTDIDFYGHITNAKYASFLDLVRVEYWARTDTFKRLREINAHFLISSSFKRYRKELRLNAKFTVKSEIIYVGPDSYYMDCQFLKDGFVHCHVVDKFVVIKNGKKSDPKEIFPWIDESLRTPPSHLAKLIKAEEEFQKFTRNETK